MLLEFLRSLGGGMNAANQPMPQAQPPQPQTGMGGMFGGLSRFNENNPGALMAIGDIIAGNDPYRSHVYGDQLRAQTADKAQATERENATVAWLLSQGMPAEKVNAYHKMGRLGDLMKPAEQGKVTDDMAEYQYAVNNGMFNGSFTDWQTKGVRDQDPTFARERDIRRDYEGQDNVKNYTKVRDSYERVRAAAQTDSGAGDIGLIFNYMKMLDPGSVVREGEFATAANAGGVGQQLINMYNQLLTGERLTPELRQQFVDASEKLYSESVGNLEDTNRRYSDVAAGWQLDPSRVVVQPERYEPLKLGEVKDMGNGVTIKKVR